MKIQDFTISYSKGTGMFQASIWIAGKEGVFPGMGSSRKTEKEAVWNAVKMAAETAGVNIGEYHGDDYSCILEACKTSIQRATMAGSG